MAARTTLRSLPHARPSQRAVMTGATRKPRVERLSAWRLIAYCLQPPTLELVPASRRREWMDATQGNAANRCLPLLIANQSGWVLLNRARVTATWDGGPNPCDCTLESEDDLDPPVSHFGSGIITWRVPYLFRTPPGWNLLMRGPANLPKDGAASLEGLIETDWATQPAFHSWKITRAGTSVCWDAGEPICMIVPQRRSELESWQPYVDDIHKYEELRDEYTTFSESRRLFNTSVRSARDWQGHYFRGESPGSARAVSGTHQTKLTLHPFKRRL